MDLSRAEQILRSEDYHEVSLNGESVWIDSLDKRNGTALVHLEDNPGRQATVPVEMLDEMTEDEE